MRKFMDNNFSVENDVYIIISKDEFDIAILAGEGLSLNRLNDNVDVELRFYDGKLLTATFFTVQNIKTLFEKNKKTGECHNGLYFHCNDMILVEELTIENIVKTIESLKNEGYLETTFQLH